MEPLRHALEPKEIILHAADYDLRMLRRGLNFTASKIFDTVIAARLLGIREFSLGALVKRFFDVELHKHSQKANWALRPLPPRMLKYAVDDVHYLLPLAAKLEEELERVQRSDWFRQSCERAIELAAAQRERIEDELWRIGGAGALDPRTGAVLRALWQWRETEAEMADRPPFHILQNRELLNAAENFASGGVPITDSFPLAGGRRSTKQQELRCNLRNRNGRLCGAAPVLVRLPKCVGAPISCANGATKRPSNLDWSDLSLHLAALSRPSQLILRGQRPCWFPGNAI